MSKHTPGPWHIGMRSGANSNMVYARDGKTEHDDFTVCAVYRMFQHCELEDQKDPVGIANARLIAAAPELLEALIAMEAEKSDYMRRNNLGDPANEHTNKMARAAIAKAEGQQ